VYLAINPASRREFRRCAAEPAAEMLGTPSGIQESSRPPASVRLLGEADLVLPERSPVRCGPIVLVPASPGNVAVDDDERRPVVARFEVSRTPSLRKVEGHCVAAAVRSTRRRDGLATSSGERELRASLDRDVVVVVDPAEVRTARDGRPATPLTDTALPSCSRPAERVHVIVEEREVGPVVARRNQRPAIASDAGATPYRAAPSVVSTPEVQ